ncbi:MAG: hypothetical protein KDA93_03635 [Planctomycetaceae bacterium]|nr:hypothetical protein [Planctomycetaceae bacterium]
MQTAIGVYRENASDGRAVDCLTQLAKGLLIEQNGGKGTIVRWTSDVL